jgi:hypothetical protein
VDVAADERVAQACAYLRMLLLRPGEYRTAWERHATAPEPGQIDNSAVAAVLGDASADDVRDALYGTRLRLFTLETFITAFALSARHAQRLRELLAGSPAVRVISGDVPPPSDLYQHGGPPRHETLSLHELHVLGPDGLPAEHETIQVIKSTVGRLDRIPYRFDTDELMVEVIRGGHVGDEIYRIGESLYGVDILLTEPLGLGETALLQYRTTFFYKAAPPPEFRRGVMRSTRDLTMWVKFHPRRVPARVWAARWDRLDHARILDEYPAELDGELSVHSRFDSVERAVVGFHWEWK